MLERLSYIISLLPSGNADIIPFPAPAAEPEPGAIPFVLFSVVILASFFIYQKLGRNKRK